MAATRLNPTQPDPNRSTVLIPKSISATALQVWESCPARYVAETLHRTPMPGGIYADLGSTCHGALEEYVGSVYVDKTVAPDLNILLGLAREHFSEIMRMTPSGELWDDCVGMLTNWFNRTDLSKTNILTLETKDFFEVKTSAGIIPFNYIFDRLDQHDDGSIEVVDYKSIRFRLSPDGLKDKIQARCYAVAAQIMYPDAPRVWVTFDLLRYDPVGIVFTREENIATWKYIKRAVNKIIATDEEDAPERINAECRFCIRKQYCETLQSHEDVGGVLTLADPLEAGRTRARVDAKIKALTAQMGELDAFLIQCAENDEIDMYEDDQVNISIYGSSMRTVSDPATALGILSRNGLAEKYAGMTLANLEKAAKESRLSEDDRMALRALIGRKPGSTKVKVTPKNPIDDPWEE